MKFYFRNIVNTHNVLSECKSNTELMAFCILAYWPHRMQPMVLLKQTELLTEGMFLVAFTINFSCNVLRLCDTKSGTKTRYIKKSQTCSVCCIFNSYFNFHLSSCSWLFAFCSLKFKWFLHASHLVVCAYAPPPLATVIVIVAAPHCLFGFGVNLHWRIKWCAFTILVPGHISFEIQPSFALEHRMS